MEGHSKHIPQLDYIERVNIRRITVRIVTFFQKSIFRQEIWPFVRQPDCGFCQTGTGGFSEIHAQKIGSPACATLMLLGIQLGFDIKP